MILICYTIFKQKPLNLQYKQFYLIYSLTCKLINSPSQTSTLSPALNECVDVLSSFSGGISRSIPSGCSRIARAPPTLVSLRRQSPRSVWSSCTRSPCGNSDCPRILKSHRRRWPLLRWHEWLRGRMVCSPACVSFFVFLPRFPLRFAILLLQIFLPITHKQERDK